MVTASTAERCAGAYSPDAEDRGRGERRKHDVPTTRRLAVARWDRRLHFAMPTGHESILSEMESGAHAARTGGGAQPGQTQQLLRRAQQRVVGEVHSGTGPTRHGRPH